ncbi:MAG: hypothetical protein ACRDV8_13935, partial [Acidimicrobiales bacterium]
DLSWHSLDGVLPWPLVAAMAVAIVVLACVLLSSILARTPLSVALTGRKRERWSTWLPQDWRRSDEGERRESVSPIDIDGNAPVTSWTDVGTASVRSG